MSEHNPDCDCLLCYPPADSIPVADRCDCGATLRKRPPLDARTAVALSMGHDLYTVWQSEVARNEVRR